MSDSPQPGQPGQSDADQPDPATAAGPTVDPQTGEDLSWKQTPMALVLLDRPAPDHREIGELLGISTENVGVRLHRARHQLKSLQAREETRP